MNSLATTMTSPKLQKSPVTKNSSDKPRLHLVRRKDRAIPYSRTSRSAPFTFSEMNKSRAFIRVEYYSDPNEYSQYSLVDLCKIQEVIFFQAKNTWQLGGGTLSPQSIMMHLQFNPSMLMNYSIWLHFWHLCV